MIQAPYVRIEGEAWLSDSATHFRFSFLSTKIQASAWAWHSMANG